VDVVELLGGDAPFIAVHFSVVAVLVASW